MVNTATCKNISPADIRKLLLVPEKKKPSNNSKIDKKVIVNKSSISLEENTKDELVINSKVFLNMIEFILNSI